MEGGRREVQSVDSFIGIRIFKGKGGERKREETSRTEGKYDGLVDITGDTWVVGRHERHDDKGAA